MINISEKVGKVLDKSLTPFPNSTDKYWNMEVIYKESITLINSMLTELAETIKIKYNLEYNSIELIKKNYEIT